MLRVINGELVWSKVDDSKKLEANAQGSMRDVQDNKGRYDLIPTSFLKRLARHFEIGSKKYAERNWEKGQPLSQYFNSAMRHLLAIQDADLSEDHFSAAIWNIAAMIHHIDKMLSGDLPVDLDSFGIVNQIREYETFEQLKDYFNEPHHITSTFTTRWSPVMMSGEMNPYLDFPKYEIPSDITRFQEHSSKVRKTVKLDPEELG